MSKKVQFIEVEDAPEELTIVEYFGKVSYRQPFFSVFPAYSENTDPDDPTSIEEACEKKYPDANIVIGHRYKKGKRHPVTYVTHGIAMKVKGPGFK